MTIIDANILVYSHNESAPHHEVSVQWLEGTVASGERLGIPWHSAMAFLRITTAPGIMRRPLRLEEASSVISGWFENPLVVVPAPGRRFWPILQELARDSATQGRGWSDAWLAALAIENGAALATFDRDFRKYRGLKLIEL